MTDDHDFPAPLTFSQRYGYEPLPEPMRLEEISNDLRRDVWNIIYSYMQAISENFLSYDLEKRKIQAAIGRYHKRPQSRIDTSYDNFIQDMENIIMRHDFNRILDFIEISIEEKFISERLAQRIKDLFEKHGAAYWLDISCFPCRFVPSASKEQGEATQHALETLREDGMDGAATHLRQAAEHIGARQYADAITDSIHAVESVARNIDPKASTTLGPALKSLEDAGLLNHPALKQAFEKLYGYTNTEQGLRHALRDKDAADVGLDEAMFMFGACASFAAYLTQKHRQARDA